VDELARLQGWYAAQCNGEWEHDFGVKIDTLDNPGWLVRVDLAGTLLAGRAFSEIAEGVGAGNHPESQRWLHCALRDGAWQGAADPTQLRRLLAVFLDWAGASAGEESRG